MTTTKPEPLLRRQFAGYPNNHAERRNLILHVLTVPLFQLGGPALIAGSLLGSWWLALCGLFAMPVAIAIQARGHALESQPPVPFTGPLDVFGRIFAEQWLTFPRFVLTGGFTRAWRAAATSRSGQS